MILLRILLNSLKLPKKQALFTLNRIGMDVTVVYMFILLLLASIPSLFHQVTTGDSTGAEMSFPFYLIYFFIFYYLPLTIIIFLYISLIAYIGAGIAKLLRRKIMYSILWKLTAYATTVPFMLYTILAFFFSVTNAFAGLFGLYTFLLLVKIITVFPRRKKR